MGINQSALLSTLQQQSTFETFIYGNTFSLDDYCEVEVLFNKLAVVKAGAVETVQHSNVVFHSGHKCLCAQD